ncbi:hypothetical protein KL86DYS2_10252 [uncultured Dysgonomonas sp.]|uniref:Uncharacterized protein n=1 Tax=uncultured Dysgonomonas sp. TaxID=206096 RepID=A0A212IXA4_9BACT|nr:hypothetical protein KL86DYS2_10252 [uncultured Dysgonomonas sp.]
MLGFTDHTLASIVKYSKINIYNKKATSFEIAFLLVAETGFYLPDSALYVIDYQL